MPVGRRPLERSGTALQTPAELSVLYLDDIQKTRKSENYKIRNQKSIWGCIIGTQTLLRRPLRQPQWQRVSFNTGFILPSAPEAATGQDRGHQTHYGVLQDRRWLLGMLAALIVSTRLIIGGLRADAGYQGRSSAQSCAHTRCVDYVGAIGRRSPALITRRASG